MKKLLRLSLSAALFLGLTAASCNNPAPRPLPPPPDVVIVSSDAGNPCAKQQAVTDARMIATESGAPLVVPCP